MLASLLLAAALAPQSPSGVVINELNYDDSSNDTLVFVELYNGSSNTVDIGNWTLNGVDGTTAGNGTHTIAAGTMLAPGEFWVVGQAAVPNVDEIITDPNILENGPDGLYLEDANLVIQDGVVWEYVGWTNPVPTWLEGDGLSGDIQLHEHPSGNFNSVSRGLDGVDTDDNGCDFRSSPWTPGTLNILGMATPLPYENDFDDPVASVVEPDFTYSFVPGNTQDPAAVQVAIITGIPQPPVAFPPSPQGGNVSLWHDPTGGGNANWLSNFTQSDYLLEAWVWFAGANANMDGDDGEFWTMGVRGHSDSFGEYQDVGGFHGIVSCTTTQSGHTGIAWTCIRSASVCELYLVDYNNGAGSAVANPGGDHTILAGPISIQTGVNDGWQRVRLCVSGTSVVGNFGGNYGCDDGQRFTASTSTTCANGVYLTYRECISDNNNMTPLMVDALVVADCVGASSSPVGTGSPTSIGVPTIAASGPPVLGDLGFTITGGNLLGFPFSGIILDLGAALPGVPVPGAPATALLYATPTLVDVQVPVSGSASFGLPLDCNPGVIGQTIVAQIFDWDATLPNGLPIGLSEGLVLTLGY